MHTYDKSVHCPPVKLKLNWFILQQSTLTYSLQSYHDLQYAQTHLYPEEGKGNVVVSRLKQDPKAHELQWMCIIYRVVKLLIKSLRFLKLVWSDSSTVTNCFCIFYEFLILSPDLSSTESTSRSPSLWSLTDCLSPYR